LRVSKSGQEPGIAFQKIVSRKSLVALPADRFENSVHDFAAPRGHVQENQQYGWLPRVRELIAHDFVTGFGLDPEFFAKLANERRRWGLSRFQFAAWKLPFQRMRLIRTASANQDFSVSFDYPGHDRRHDSSFPSPCGAGGLCRRRSHALDHRQSSGDTTSPATTGFCST